MAVDIRVGDALKLLRAMPDGSVQCVVTSPPYFRLRDYGVAGQIGLEATAEAFIDALVAVFAEVRRVLRDDGTCWINIGDSFARNPAKGKTGTPTNKSHPKMGYSGGAGIPAGIREKEQIGIPWMLAFALRRDGWFLRQEVIWNKTNAKPEPALDRLVTSHEQLFLLTKGPRYHFDAVAIREPAVCSRMRGPGLHPDRISTNGNAGLGRRKPTGMRNKRSVWSVQYEPFPEAHFATYPPALIEPCILAGCPVGGVVLDPFGGAGTTGLVADRLGRDAILLELNPDYAALAARRVRADADRRANEGV